MRTTVAHKVRTIPAWQIAAVLVVFPALYMANSFMPWSRALFVDGRTQGPWYAFWSSAGILWWTSVATAAFIMRRHGWALTDVGINVGDRQRRKLVIGAVTIGLAAVVVRELSGPLPVVTDLVKAWSHNGAPHTAVQRLLWMVFGVVSAAFCEEFVYRGFGYHALRSRGMRIGIAASLASLAWIGVHGLAAVYGFAGYAFLALVFAVLLVRTKSLVPGLMFHAAIHVCVILGS